MSEYEHPLYKLHLETSQEKPLFNAEPSTAQLYEAIPETQPPRKLNMGISRVTFTHSAELGNGVETTIASAISGKKESLTELPIVKLDLPPVPIGKLSESGEASSSDGDEIPVPKHKLKESIEPVPKRQKTIKEPSLSDEPLESEDEPEESDDDETDESLESGVAEEEAEWLAREEKRKAQPKVIGVSSSGRKIKRVERMEEVMKEDFREAARIHRAEKEEAVPVVQAPVVAPKMVAQPDDIDFYKIIREIDGIDEHFPETFALFRDAWKETALALIVPHFDKKEKVGSEARMKLCSSVLELCKPVVFAKPPKDPRFFVLWKVQRIIWAYNKMDYFKDKNSSRICFKFFQPAENQGLYKGEQHRIYADHSQRMAFFTIRAACRPNEMITSKLQEFWHTAQNHSKKNREQCEDMLITNATQILKNTFVDWVNNTIISRFKILD